MKKWLVSSLLLIGSLLPSFLGAANTATLSEDVAWSAIRWDSTYDTSQPVEFALTKPITLTFDTSVSLQGLTVKGGHRLSLVLTKVPEIRLISTEGASSVLLKGGDSSSTAVTWASPIALDGGSLAIQGYLNNASNSGFVSGRGTVAVESGKLDLKNSRWELGAGLTLKLHGGATIDGAGDGYSAIDLCGVTNIVVCKGSLQQAGLSAPIRYRGDAAFKSPKLTIEENVILQFDETVAENGEFSDMTGWAVEVGGAGSLSLGENAVVPVSTNGFCTGGLSGYGTLSFEADPTGSAAAGFMQKAGWQGTCRLRGATVPSFSPAALGNAGSKISFMGASCTLASTPKYAPELVMDALSAAYPFSLELTVGNGASVDVGSFSGKGRFVLSDASGAGSRVYLPRTCGCSLAVEGESGGIVIGADEKDKPACADESYEGRLSFVRGTSEIPKGATWSACRGIFLREGTTLTDRGEILGPVVGKGTVIYTGVLGSSQPEKAAAFTDGNSWSGRVTITSASLQNCDLSASGNEKSSVRIQSSSGSLAGTVVSNPIELSGEGLRVTDALPGSTVTFAKLTGNGPLSIVSGNKGAGSAVRVLDVSGYSGAFSVTDTSGCSLVLGEDPREADGILQISDGFTLKSKRSWKATKVVFGRTLYVNGQVGDTLFSVTGASVDFRYVKVHLVNGLVDVRRRYALVFDGSSKQLRIEETITPPTVEVDDVSVTYGTDFESAVIRLSVTNFWEGYEFSGQAIAQYRVYNASGRLVAAGDGVIADNGTVVIGEVALPGGRGSDYRYEIDVMAMDDAGSVIEKIDTISFADPSVHFDEGWFHETPATFGAGGQDGEWQYKEGQAFVTNNGTAIAIKAFEDADRVRFKPRRDVTEGLVKVETDVVFESPVVMTAIADPASNVCRSAGLTIVSDDNPLSTALAYAVWVPDEDCVPAGGRFTRVYGNARPTLGAPHRVGWTVNYRTGRVTYVVDGAVLTNANGISSFRIPDSFPRGGKAVCYSGAGTVATLDGDVYNANLASAAAETGDVQYDTVEEAVAAAKGQEDAKVKLLWDATWSPVTSDVGRTVEFDLNGHTLTLDPAATNRFASEGYCVVDLGNGAYRIDVITYYIGFDINGGNAGSMDPQPYSVTNRVFELAANQFEKDGCDFASWNLMADGTGETNWADRAMIDMTPFGLTNMTLYAQWQVAVRRIVVAAADEFVYIESVLTNGVKHTGVRYFQEDAATATGRAEIPVFNGSDLIIRFSTDLEKRLTFEYVKATEAIVKDGVIGKADLPEIYQEGVNEILDPIHEWAASRGISFSALNASVFSQASYRLNLDQLLEEGSKVEITDFRVNDGFSSFKVVIDGKTLVDAARVLPMIRVADAVSADAADWQSPEASEVSVAADGTVTVRTGKFVKIVIPQNY